MNRLTIPAGVSFREFTQRLNSDRDTAYEPNALASALGVTGDLSKPRSAPLSIDLSAFGLTNTTAQELQRFVEKESQRDVRSPRSVFGMLAGALSGKGQVVRGPAAGYAISEASRTRVAKGEITPADVREASTSAGDAVSQRVERAMSETLGDGVLTQAELSGGAFAKALGLIGLDVGGSIMGAMRKDTLLQLGKLDPNDYRVLRDLAARADLPPGRAGRITMEPGARAKIDEAISSFEGRLIQGARAGAFVEKLGDQVLVNQTAMTWAPVSSEELFSRLPPERWAEECFDLRALHTQVLSRQTNPDGGYSLTMLQRMEFGDSPVATDMTKLTVVDKWRDDQGRWCASARWKVFASEPTSQIAHGDSMRIDQGRMEFRAVEKDGEPYTEITFNNRTQTNTELEKKLFDRFLSKESTARGRISAELAAAELAGIQDFAKGVVSRYRAVGTGEEPARWPSLLTGHVEGIGARP